MAKKSDPFSGGRGKPAPYQSTPIRVPIPIKDNVELIITQYKLAVKSGNELEFMQRLTNQLDIFRLIIDEKIAIPENVISDAIKKEITEVVKQDSTPKTLTNSQLKALENITKWLTSRERFFRLSGYAGTGKSFLMSYVLRDNKSLEIIAAAPTNKAAKNLKRILKEQGINCDVTTIAKLLKELPNINESTGKEIFESTSQPDFDAYDLIIFDEYSMIGKETFENIKDAFKGTDSKGLFLGDPAQLPPINEKISPIAELDLSYNSTLLEVVRYEGEIGKVAEAIRSNPIYNESVYPFQTTEDQTIICINNRQYESILREYFLSNKFNQDTDYIRVLAFRNVMCDYHNRMIREILHGDNLKAFNIGDILITKSPLFRMQPNKKENPYWAILINNSEEMKVTGNYTEEKISIDGLDLTYYSVPIITIDGLKTDLNVLSKSSKETFERHLKKLADQAKKTKQLWTKFYDLKKRFDDIAFAYCLTTHKAQGSSIDTVILDLPDLARCQDRQKMIYTALTRAKRRAYILS